jgi:hypothetical protein
MLRALSLIYRAFIPHHGWGNWSLFGQLLTLRVYRPGHNTTRQRLLQTDLVRVQGGPQVKSSTNTPVMQGAKQMHIERRCAPAGVAEALDLGRDIWGINSASEAR